MLSCFPTLVLVDDLWGQFANSTTLCRRLLAKNRDGRLGRNRTGVVVADDKLAGGCVVLQNISGNLTAKDVFID